MASRRSTWCSLCGVLISTSQGDPEDASLSWLSDVRVVRTLGHKWDVLLTGVGYLDNRKQVYASADPADHWRRTAGRVIHQDHDGDNNAGGEDGVALPAYAPHSLYSSSLKYWCFPFHDVCWSLLKDKVLPSSRTSGQRSTEQHRREELKDEEEERELARQLFAVLYNTPIHAYDRLTPGHDYGGAGGLRQITRRQGYFFQVRASRFPYIIDDPREMMQTDEHCLWKAVERVSRPFARDEPPLLADGPITVDTLFSTRSGKMEPFARLPYEVVMIVFTHLPSTDLCKLRLASRGAARMSSPNQLPQTFWRSRFDPELEMAFVFAGDAHAHLSLVQSQQPDWRDIYIKAKANLTDGELFPGLRNRQRIWHCLQPVASAVKVRLRNKGCTSQVPHAKMTPPLATGEKHGNWVCSDAVLAPMPAPSLTMPELVASCRLTEMQKLSWLPSFRQDGGGSVVLKAAFADYCGKLYISGLSLENGCYSDAGYDAVRRERAGYAIATRFEEVVLDASWEVCLVEVALRCTGLSGVRLHLLTPDGLQVVKIIGEMSPSESDVGISKLTISDGTTLSALIVGLDAFKVVSLSLVEQSHIRASRDLLLESAKIRTAPPAEIWTPKQPDSAVLWPFRNVWRSQLHDLCLNMDFGGYDGGQLCRLTQVVARMTQYPSVFVGMRFVYEDGTARQFGASDGLLDVAGVSDSVLEQVFSIDGPGGEVIDHIDVAYSIDHEEIRKISIHTNLKRSIDFALQSKSDPEDTLSIRKLKPEPGSLLTVFYAKVKMPGRLPPSPTNTAGTAYYDLRGYFRNFSVGTVVAETDETVSTQSTTANESVDHMLPINRTTLAPVEMMLQHHGGFVFSGADLSNIKRLTVSVGSKGDRTSDTMITGLWLTYHDSKLPVVLGQWREEGDSLEVAPDDRLVGVQVWHDWGRTAKRLPLGPVVGLLFRLASGLEKKFARRYVVERDCLSFRENRYEGMTGILWGCNHKWDHVWILTTPNPSVPRLLLGQDVADFVKILSMTNIVHEKVFIPSEVPWGSRNISRTENLLVAIEVTFWKLDKVPNSMKLFFQHGPPRILGHPQSAHRLQRITLDAGYGEELTCLHIGVTGSGETSQIAFITFTTNKGRELDFREEWWSTQSTAITHWHEKVPLHVFYPFTPEAVKMSQEMAAALERAESSLSSADSGESTSSPATATIAPMYHSPAASRAAASRMGGRYSIPVAHDESSNSTMAETTQPSSDHRAMADQTAPPLAQRQAQPAWKLGATPKVKVVDIPPGAGRFVGLWALANHALEYPLLGPMFEAKADQNE